MNRTSIIVTVVTGIAGPLLLWAWLRTVHVSWDELVRLIATLNPAWLALAIAGIAVNIGLAGEKWRRVEQQLSGRPPSRRQAVAFTSIGTALGQFLPTPLASALIRGGGNHLHLKEGGRRGALASVWEQLFDLGVVAVLLPAAVAALSLRRPELFVIGAPISAVFGDPVVRWGVPWVVGALPRSSLLADRGLCLVLYRISLARFAVLSAQTAAIALAMASPIPLAALATSIPPVAASAVASLLPAGLGVNEWSFLFVLGVFGVPAAIVASFALVNRIVVAVTSLTLGALSALLVRFGAPAR